MEQARLYRKESLDRIQSPEQLNDYLRVTNPSVWILLIAVILLLVGLLVWGSLTYIDSVVYGQAVVDQGVMTVRFQDPADAERLEPGMHGMRTASSRWPRPTWPTVCTRSRCATSRPRS